MLADPIGAEIAGEIVRPQCGGLVDREDHVAHQELRLISRAAGGNRCDEQTALSGSLTLPLRKSHRQARDTQIAAPQPAMTPEALDNTGDISRGNRETAASIQRRRRDAGDVAADVHQRATGETGERLERGVNRLLETKAGRDLVRP